MGLMASLYQLRFDDAQEHAFQQANALPRLKHFVISGAISLVNFNAFLLVDAMLVPDVLEQAVLLRLFLFTPLGAAFIWLCWRYRSVVLTMPPWLMEAGVAAYGVVAGLTIAMLLHQTHSPYVYAYHAGFVAVLLYGNLVQRLRFASAVPFTVTILMIHYHAAWTGPAMPEQVKWPMLAFVSAMAFYTLLTNHRLEHEERQRFVQLSRAQLLRGQLKDSRAQLEVVSRLDALTGVANRRGFDIHLQNIAGQQRTDGAGMALLMVDVDNFKAFNDRYGHPAGDECLRLVAKELDSRLPKSDALVARWGGEEFVLLVPGMGQEAAWSFAHELLGGIQGLGIRHDSSDAASSVTVSIGLAVWAGSARSPQESLEQLVSRADEALYQAKRLGRNRVMAARTPAAPGAGGTPSDAQADVPDVPDAPDLPGRFL
jgi:diguanylate cyclase (GGDEF)-like protein